MPLLSLFAAVRRPAWLGARVLWRLALGLLLTLWSVGLAAWLTLHWWILPRLDDWRPRIEAQAGRALGTPVQIGQISVYSSGWVPAFVLRDVVLHDQQGREALRLPRVSAALSVPALLALRLRFAQLLIDDARLEVRRDAEGRWHVAGMDVDASAPTLDASALADWFFDQPEFVVRGGVLRWVDEQRAAPPLQLSAVQLVLRNRGRGHELRLDASPPADWGQRFTVLAQARGPLLARAGDWQRWKGTLHVDLPRADVAQLRRYVDLPVDLHKGEAALRAWIDWDRGVPLALTLDAALRDVSLRLASDLAPLAFGEMGGRFVVERQADAVKLSVERLAFSTAEGRAWAPSRLALQWRQSQPTKAGAAPAREPVTGGEISADRLDLVTLAQIGERLPIGTGLRDLLRRLDPAGTVRQLQARWDGPLDAPRSYSARASVRGLAIAAAPAEPGAIGRPGWRGADLEISASQSGGQADLTLANGSIELPGVFEQSKVPLTHLAAQLLWRIEPVAAGALGSPPAPGGAAQPAPGRSKSTQPAPHGSAPAVPGPGAGLAPVALRRIEVKVVNARFDNDDARGALDATWHTGSGSGFGTGGRLPGVLELAGTLAEGRASSIARYLPLGIGAATRTWVQHAVQAGQVRDVTYRVKGDLGDFPFVNRREGEFRIAGKVQDVMLAPVPAPSAGPEGSAETARSSAWPAFMAVSGELVFERNSMQFQHARGRLWGFDLGAVQGRIRELSTHAVLEIAGQARGPAADLLRYLRSTPLDEWSGGALAQASANGAVELELGLDLPLGRSADTVFKAGVQLNGNDLRLRPDLPLLAGARGRVEATHKGIQVIGLRAQAAGGEAQIDGGSQPDGSQRWVIAGTASADGLRRAANLGTLAPWAQRLQGQAPYRIQLGVRRGLVDWQLASSLKGLAIDLPAPLHKVAEASLPLRLGSVPQLDASAATAAAGQRGVVASPAETRPAVPREWWRLELGALQASALIERSPAGPRPLRSALSFGRALPDPVVGGHALLVLPRLDVDAWRSLASTGAASSPADAASDSHVIDPVWLPRSVRLETTELLAGGRRLSGVTLDLQRLATKGDAGWHAEVAADQMAGAVEYREPRDAAGAGRVKARLTRLSLPPAEADTVADSVAHALDRAPQRVPALDIEIDDFELRGHKLGRLAVQAVNRVAGAASGAAGSDVDAAGARSQWQLDRLQLGNPDARLAASGRWQALAGSARRHMALDFTLDLDDGGALLERLGFGRLVRGAKGRMSGTLGWDGSPLDLDLPTLGGTLTLALDGGRFLKADAGAARLLGVLSLQALPRRLLLDFRDVFQEGFAFDHASADVALAGGVASTRNLRLRGLQALVLMEGRADIARATQDLHVVVLPELNTASAALGYAAINPAVGLGAFIGQWLLREPLRQASAREFHITGGWDEPKVERIERGLFAPLPAAANAGAAPTPGASAAGAMALPASVPAAAPRASP